MEVAMLLAATLPAGLASTLFVALAGLLVARNALHHELALCHYVSPLHQKWERPEELIPRGAGLIR